MVVKLGVGSSSEMDGENVITAAIDAEGFITSMHAKPRAGNLPSPSMVFDVAWWKCQGLTNYMIYREDNEVNLVGSQNSASRSRLAGGGRQFVLNTDGTVA